MTDLTRPNEGYDSPGVKLIPPYVFYTCILGGGLLEFLFSSAVPVPMVLHALLGLSIGGAGFVFMMSGHGLFKRLGTNVPTFLPSTTLVTSGPYRYSRNPMYVGMTGFLLGIGVAIGSLWLSGAAVLLAVYFVMYVVPREEAYMGRRYGEAYREYCTQVPRWL